MCIHQSLISVFAAHHNPLIAIDQAVTSKVLGGGAFIL